MVVPNPQDLPAVTEFDNVNAVQLSVEESQSHTNSTPPPVTLGYLRAMVRARLLYYPTPLPEGYQLPAGIKLEDILPPVGYEPPPTV
jgi:hypothetical protein